MSGANDSYYLEPGDEDFRRWTLPMNDSKPWYTSITIWSGIVAAFAGVLALVFHRSISNPDQQTTAEQLAGIGAAISGLVAVYGRVRASKTIGAGGAAVVLLLLSMAVVAAGCSPTKQYIVATDSYATALDVLADARQAGKINDQQYRQAEAARQVAAAVLDRWKQSLTEGDTLKLTGIAQTFADALSAMKEAGGIK